MRKYIIDEIHAFIKDLQEAVRVFKENGQLFADEIVAEMIQAFDRLYVYLKKHISMEELPSFFELLNEMNDSIEAACSGQAAAEKFYTAMYALLERIVAELSRADVTLEVVFLPYKASMWDSFDSVWQEAFQDEKCNCTVAALPYFTKHEDGSLSERICEKELFPDYVPVIDAEDYDFAAKYPDIIFIHNPYDEYNQITTVDPKFYSQNLKQYTKKLVYIPYFVADEELEDNFCILPALRSADLVIVESEKIAEQYKKNYMWENKEKFVAWGSPKYDMVFADANAVKQRLPDEWKERIGDRKVILYNTHLNPLLNHPERAIEKIRYVIGLFSKRKDVLLLWRPHPLSLPTLERTNKQAEKMYREVVDEFIQEKRGIYDDTADLTRAIVISDAYLGDHSSLVHLFKKVGKPVFVQNSKEIFQVTDEEKRGVIFDDAYFSEEGIWFSASTHNGLYYYDSIMQKLYFKGIFPGEESFTGHLFSKVFFYKGRLIFIPFNAKKIVEYNTADGTFQCKEIPMEKCQHASGQKNHLFHQAIMEGKRIYLLPWAYHEILCYDIEERQLQTMKTWNKLLQKYTFGSAFKFWDAKIIDGRIAAPYHEGNYLFFFDLKGKRNDIFTIGNDGEEGFSSIEISGNDYYLGSVKKGHILRYSMHDGQCEYYSFANIPSSFRIESARVDDTLYFGDSGSGSLLVMNLNSDSVQFLSMKAMPFASMKIYKKNKLVLFPRPKDASSKMQIFSDGKLEKTLSIRFSNTKERREVFRELFLYAQKCCQEAPFAATMEEYIWMITEIGKAQMEVDDMPCGRIIYEKLFRKRK